MDWIARVELFEQLRQEHEFGVGTIAGVAAKFGVHRRMVRQAIGGALPSPHRYPARAKPKLDAVVAFIDQVLDADRLAPRKQRHTARRIYRRILTELPDAAVAESTVRNHVRARKRAMGLVLRETFVPQSYALGQEAQVDWYEAWADIGGERTGHFPSDSFQLERCKPVCETIPGWTEDITAARKLSDLPPGARRYIDRVAELVGLRVSVVSVGPDWAQTILA